MTHSKLAFRIPYPLKLHIEETQIYTQVDTEIEEQKQEKKPVNKYEELNMENTLF